ncbi:MAG TPA: alpha/beta hydrolase [Thermomicrobiales bacterium]|nr:alpha/beta hydrolase [Thermomicrobiales bacterium]
MTGDPRRHAYGPAPAQCGDLRLPAGAGPCPVVILIHGGYWRARYGLDLMDGLGDDLARRGVASWNIEYRRVGEAGGGWPGTFQDVSRAADTLRDLATRHPLDLARVVAVGHSAGGHLALWLAARPRLDPAARRLLAPGPPDPPLAGVVGLAGVNDLALAWRLGLSNGAAGELLGGGPDTVPGRYAAASPAALLPLGVPQVLLHGSADADVPLELSTAYAAAATAAGDTVRLRELPGVDHFAPIDPHSAAWGVALAELLPLLGRAP